MRDVQGTDVTHTLGEVNVNTMVVDEDPLHFEICLLAVLLILEFDECILKTVSCTLVSDDFTRKDFAEAAENQIQILI